MSNRVEELEKTVKELRATVNGLTEELVETKERVRQLEDAGEVEVERSSELSESGTKQEGTPAQGDVGVVVESDEEAKSTGSDEADEAGESEATDGDIIVA